MLVQQGVGSTGSLRDPNFCILPLQTVDMKRVIGDLTFYVCHPVVQKGISYDSVVIVYKCHSRHYSQRVERVSERS